MYDGGGSRRVGDGDGEAEAGPSVVLNRGVGGG